MKQLTADEVENLVTEAEKDFPWLRRDQIYLMPTGNTLVPGQVGIEFDVPGENLPAYYEVRRIYR